MPTYEYQCNVCGFLFEELVTLSKRNHVQGCPQCVERCAKLKKTIIKSAIRTDRLYARPFKFGKIEDNN